MVYCNRRQYGKPNLIHRLREHLHLNSGRKLLLGVILLTLAVTPLAPAAGPLFRSLGSRQHWYQIGKASWYGGQFQGRKTAAGEPYDMNQLTCAHRTLPLGTWLKVTNLHNRKTVYVRVTDRGPVPEDRIVDLSYAAAQSVGISGLGQVRLEMASMDDPEVAKAMLDQVRMPPLVPRLLLPGIR